MILVDTSVWLDYLAGKEGAKRLEPLIDSNAVCVNDLILAELLPSIKLRIERELEELFLSVHKVELAIDWPTIIRIQTINLKNGINRVGIPDIIIAHNAIEHDIPLFTMDKHFQLMSTIHPLKLY